MKLFNLTHLASQGFEPWILLLSSSLFFSTPTSFCPMNVVSGPNESDRQYWHLDETYSVALLPVEICYWANITFVDCYLQLPALKVSCGIFLKHHSDFIHHKECYITKFNKTQLVTVQFVDCIYFIKHIKAMTFKWSWITRMDHGLWNSCCLHDCSYVIGKTRLWLHVCLSPTLWNTRFFTFPEGAVNLFIL